jgi:hypothetical protein
MLRILFSQPRCEFPVHLPDVSGTIRIFPSVLLPVKAGAFLVDFAWKFWLRGLDLTES